MTNALQPPFIDFSIDFRRANRNRAVFLAIIERRSITRDALRRLFGLTAAALDVIVDRLVATGDIEQNRRLTRGRPVTRYELGRGPVFWGSSAA